VKEKVYAYIIKDNRLLIFRHTQFPEAGLQVPGGTVEAGEPLEEAVLREAEEESGLVGLKLVASLGSQEEDLATPGLGEGSLRRHFFLLRLDGDAPETWLSYEWNPSDGSPAPIEFEFFWVPLNLVPELAGDQGRWLGQLPSSPFSNETE
jgi:8-oxo-dGTP pyrophosphatase MutT (NUDIX family)